jgi:DNA-binding NarL/FixJ family response regulator
VLHIHEAVFWQEQIRHMMRSVRPAHVLNSGSLLQAVALCSEHNADTVLLDRALTHRSDLLPQLLNLRPVPRVVLLTPRAAPAALYQIERLGLAGLLAHESLSVQTLRQTFAALSAGNRIFPPGADEAWRSYKARPDAFTKRLHEDAIALLPRFGLGESDAQIAAAIGRTVSTVRWRRYETMRRLNLHRTIDLIFWIREMGFVD